MLSCFGCFGSRTRDDDQEPLLAQYRDDTALQQELHQKLHTYQMLRAIASGSLPSTEQIIVNLRTLLASDLFDANSDDLSDSGRALVHYSKLWLRQLIELFQHKNGQDQIQDFVWYLSESRVRVDVGDIVERSSVAKARADTEAGRCCVG